MTIAAEIAGVVSAVRAEVATLHAELPRWGLVVGRPQRVGPIARP